MTANGNSPLDNMRTLEHYLSDIMRAGAADTPEHLKGMSHISLSRMQLRRYTQMPQRRAISADRVREITGNGTSSRGNAEMRRISEVSRDAVVQLRSLSGFTELRNVS